MKWILCTDELEVSEMCEWVQKDCWASWEYVNLGDLESDRDYVRCVRIADDTKCRVLSNGLKRFLDDEWIPVENLSYDSNVGLRWHK